jgi:hypothetical protein
VDGNGRDSGNQGAVDGHHRDARRKHLGPVATPSELIPTDGCLPAREGRRSVITVRPRSTSFFAGRTIPRTRSMPPRTTMIQADGDYFWESCATPMTCPRRAFQLAVPFQQE